MRRHAVLLPIILACVASSLTVNAQQKMTPEENLILKRIGGLRQLADDARAVETKKLAIDIRILPDSKSKVLIANILASQATEGDFGKGTLQEVTTTLAEAVAAVTSQPQGQTDPARTIAGACDELAQLAKYEHMSVSAKIGAPFAEAVKKLDATDKARAKVDFTLTDIAGHRWTLSSLKGNVVLVNFWATWCPPCKKEMPDLQALYDQFKSKGFVILSISDETSDKVAPFIADHKYTWPILLDPGRKVNTMYQIDGIPKSFLYNRSGKLVAQTIDMRTRDQFLTLFAQAGLK